MFLLDEIMRLHIYLFLVGVMKERSGGIVLLDFDIVDV
jgi:hypothetical protein